jgi:hypothetical protein
MSWTAPLPLISLPMVARSAVTLERLQQLMLEVGFAQSKRGVFWEFRHADSDVPLT